MEAGSFVPRVTLSTIKGQSITIPSSAQRLIHLMFRRYAGCPVCNLHLRNVARQKEAIKAAGIVQIVIVASPKDEVRKHMDTLPFDLVPDPDLQLYETFGVQRSVKAFLDPRATARAVQGFVTGASRKFVDTGPGLTVLPAEFLIGPSGKILAAKYGQHAYDQWDVSELLALAKA